jgi:hypothetical protein
MTYSVRIKKFLLVKKKKQKIDMKLKKTYKLHRNASGLWLLCTNGLKPCLSVSNDEKK